MSSTNPSLSLVIPCFNEAKRFHFLEKEVMSFQSLWHGNFEVIIVNDGSTDDTISKAKVFQKNYSTDLMPVKVVHYEINKGKGYALKSGVMEANGEWILTLDADMSTKPEELLNWLKLIGKFNKNTVYIASRAHQDSRIQARSHRKLLGTFFNKLITIYIGLKIEDTQCGFKLYPKDLAQKIFPELKTRGWANDIELLMRCKKMRADLICMPVTWIHKDGGSISVLTDGVKMVLQVFRIKRLIKNEIAN